MKYLLCISFFICLTYAADNNNGATVSFLSSKHADDDEQAVRKSKSVNDIKQTLRMHGGASTTQCPKTPAHVALIKTLEGSNCTKMCPWHCKSKGDSPHPYVDDSEEEDSFKEKKQLKRHRSENKKEYFELSDRDE